MQHHIKIGAGVARRLEISGVVQGVGFRPFLFQLAAKFGFTGEVLNTPGGVSLVVEGDESRMDLFAGEIRDNAPPLACVTAVTIQDVPLNGYEGFSIVRSQSGDAVRTALIPPDVSVCKECLEEMNDPNDRRYGYPFINCTNCGPRYTIIRDIPYDRPKTSMADFPMCSLCRKEYEDPMNRRFHAQPNACPVCGPRVFLRDNLDNPLETDDPIGKAGEFLRDGLIVAIKGLGGFHLAVDGTSARAVARLREMKPRPHKPLALMVASVEIARCFVHISKEEEELLLSHQRPIVLLKQLEGAAHGGQELNGLNIPAPEVAGTNRYLGIMLPYTPLHALLLSRGPEILVMTSGNRSGEPLSCENRDAMDAFGHIADYFLLHNRDILFRADDSIIQHAWGAPRFVRRSRGYAPLPLKLRKKGPRVLALGGGLKSTVCLTRGDQAFLSPHIGDLDNPRVFEFFKESLVHLKRIMDIEPSILAHDLHPGYMSTAHAMTWDTLPKVGVQHHHAHAVSCMAENRLEGEVLAVTLDGTGLGSDGTIWGGEILACTETGFTRMARLAPLAMPGGDAAVKETWRMGISWLYQVFGDGFMDLDLPLVRSRDDNTLEFITRMITRGINSPLTSSCGRLFDAAAAILGVREKVTYEGQAAMELQAAARGMEKEFPFEINLKGDSGSEPLLEIDPGPGVRALVSGMTSRVPVPLLAARFHSTVVCAFVRAAEFLKRETGLNRVVLSGGVFNNPMVLGGMGRKLEQSGFTVYTHTRVPAGDGGISLGQAVVAGALERS